MKNHNCIQIRTGNGVIYRWDVEKNGNNQAIDVPGQLCVNEPTFGIEMALADRGITYRLEEHVSNHLARGQLQIVRLDWAPIEPALYM